MVRSFSCVRLAGMFRSAVTVALALFLLPSINAQTSPFVGRWDFTIVQSNGKQAADWLGIKEKGEGLDIWFQPTGGHVIQVTDYKVNGSHLTLNIGHGLVWELDAQNGKLSGTQKHGGSTISLTACPLPN